jgi:DNA-binding response OmpR family regulator
MPAMKTVLSSLFPAGNRLRTDREKPCILLVDDSVEEQRHLIELLRPNYRLTLAFNGRQGYQRALAVKPALILLDVAMPDLDGFSTCRLLKADPSTREIPVIFLTSANSLEERLMGLTQGGVDYVAKPFVSEEVLARIRIHLDLARPAFFPSDRTAPASTERDPDKIVLTAATRLIGERLQTPLVLEEIARQVGVHGKKLSRIFRERLGLTVFAFIREERIRQASRLLTETDQSIQDIAEQVGFQNAANFATAFRERIGVTPRDYRRVMRTKQESSEC